MKHIDGLSRKAYHNGDNGNIKELPDIVIARCDLSDEFWLSKIKPKEINMLDCPKRTIRPPQRYSTNVTKRNKQSIFFFQDTSPAMDQIHPDWEL